MRSITITWGLVVNNLFNQTGKACQRLSPITLMLRTWLTKTVDTHDLPAYSHKVIPLLIHVDSATVSICYAVSFPIFPHPLLLRPRIERI